MPSRREGPPEGEAGNHRSGAANTPRTGRERPDVCIIDVRMPPAFSDEGLRAAIEIRSRWPATPVLVLSQYVEERYATELLSGDTNGIGYLLKQRVADVRDFLDALVRLAERDGARS